ncbi:MAG: PEP-CTERM sorting domain-containing protein, partial [Thermoanaerobaculia bacterium]
SQAAIVDLTSDGASGTINGAIFMEFSPQPTGTGYIDPFVRIHNEGDSPQDPTQGFESGYNTDGQIEFNTKEEGGHNWTHSIKVSDLQVVNQGGTDYYVFMLDINEVSSKDGRLLSLNEVEIYLGASGDLTGYPNLGTKIYEMDAGGDNTVELDYKLNNGSGSGDMLMLVPVSLFTGPNQFVYLYSEFGNPNHEDDGFEEWAAVMSDSPPPPPPPPPIPEPTTMLLLGAGLVAMGGVKKLRRKSA